MPSTSVSSSITHRHIILLSSGSIISWRAVERFYAKYFDFLFNNTSACYLVFAFFFPILLAFILQLCFVEYSLE